MNDSAPGIAQIPPNNPADEAVVRLGPGLFKKDLWFLLFLGVCALIGLGALLLYIAQIFLRKVGPDDVGKLQAGMLAVQINFFFVFLVINLAQYVRFLELTPQSIRRCKFLGEDEISLAEVDRCVLSPQNNRWEWTLVFHSKSGAELSGPLPIGRSKDRKKVLAFLLELESRGLKLENLVKFRKALIENKWGSVPEWDQRVQEALGSEIYRCPYEPGYLEKFRQTEIRWFDFLPAAPLFGAYLGMKYLDWPRFASPIGFLLGWVLLILLNRTRKEVPPSEFVLGENGIGFLRGNALVEAYPYTDLKSLKFGFVRYSGSPHASLQIKFLSGQEMEFDLETRGEGDREVLKAATEKVKSLQAGSPA